MSVASGEHGRHEEWQQFFLVYGITTDQQKIDVARAGNRGSVGASKRDANLVVSAVLAEQSPHVRGQ